MGDLLTWIFSHHDSVLLRLVLGVIACGVVLYALYILLMIGAVCYGFFLEGRKAARRFKSRDRSIPLSRRMGAALRKSAVWLQREIRLTLAAREKERVFVSNLGSWPPIWRYKISGDYLLKARHYDAHHAYKNAPQKAACITGIVWFGIIMLGNNGTEGDKFIAGSIFAVVCGGLSWPVWWRVYQSKLNFTFSDGRVGWQGRDKYKGGPLAGGTKIEVLWPHPQAEEELRVFNENLRTGAIPPKTKFKPVYQRASQVVALSGFNDSDWQIIADLTDDPRGRRAFKLKSAIEFVHAKNVAETLVREREEIAHEGERFR